MRKWGFGFALLAVGLVAVLTLAGCSGGMRSVDNNESTTAAVQTLYLAPFIDNASQTPRWMDIADYLYGGAFRASFAYPSNLVQLTFDDLGALQFTITAPARALKPNFCYQMKIEGPAQPWSGDITGADFTNWSLGSNGRWWNDTDNIPLTDAQLSSHVGDVIKGYLYFDFIFTNKDGSVSQVSPVRNSYHVTWKTSQRARGANDGPARACSVVAAKDRWAYDKTKKPVTVNLYGEWEPGRDLPGQLVLPAGPYSGVEFRLTEESFHAGSKFGGKWRTVMTAPLPDFTVQ